jgi:hypothetical protein
LEIAHQKAGTQLIVLGLAWEIVTFPPVPAPPEESAMTPKNLTRPPWSPALAPAWGTAIFRPAIALPAESAMTRKSPTCLPLSLDLRQTSHPART